MIYIYTVCYNTPKFVSYQYKLFKRHLKDDFKYIVYNNTKTDRVITDKNINNHNILVNICNNLGISNYEVPSNLFNGQPNDASNRVGIAVDFATEDMLNRFDNNNIFMLIDNDAFLISPINIEEFMSGTKLSGRHQYRMNNQGERVNYVTNQLLMYKPSLFSREEIQYLSLKPGKFNGAATDCGGNIDNIFRNVKDIGFKNWNNFLFSKDGNDVQIGGGDVCTQQHYNENYSQYLDNIVNEYISKDNAILGRKFPFCEIFVYDQDSSLQFLHLRSGTNWINFDINSRKTLLYETLDKLVEIDLSENVNKISIEDKSGKKKVFSFSLYDSGNYWGGNREKYTFNCVANVIIAKKLFPDWILYVYYDNMIC